MYQLSQTLQTALNAGNPQRVLIEFTNKPDGTAYNPVRQFSNEDILVNEGVRMTTEFNSETDLTIGLCPSAEIQFDMLNDNGQLTDFEFGQFTAYLGAKITSGTPGSGAKTKTYSDGLYEFAPLGVFIAKRPDIVRKSIISVDANDLMSKFDVDMPKAADLNMTYPATLKTLTQKMCTYLGVSLQSSSWLNSSLSVAAEPEQFSSSTMREVLGWVAEAGCSNACFNRQGKLRFAWFNQVDKTYDEHDYTEFSPTWYATAAIDGLHIRNADSTVEYVVGSGDNAYMIQDNPFLRQAE